MTETRQSISLKEGQLLLDAAQKQSLRCLFTILLIAQTGLRSHEAARFTPDWFDPTTETITVPARKWKSNMSRNIPLHPQISQQIAHGIRELDETAFNVPQSTIQHRVRVAGEDAGLGRINGYTLRASLLRRLNEHGGSDDESDGIVTDPNMGLYGEWEAPDEGPSTDGRVVTDTTDESGGEWEFEAESEIDTAIERYLAANEGDLTEDVLTVHEVYLTHFRDWCVEPSCNSSNVEFPMELGTTLDRYVSERIDGSSASNVNERQQVLQQFRRWILR